MLTDTPPTVDEKLYTNKRQNEERKANCPGELDGAAHAELDARESR